MTIPDMNAVDTIIRDVAADIIMPLFRSLDDSAIYEKRPGELVTDADVAAEQYLAERLCALVPASALLGEECFEDDSSLMDLMDSDGPVWVVDPIDGTGNFARGHDCFAVMVAYREAQETLAAWIYDPVTDRMLSARKDGGAYVNGAVLTASGQGGAIESLTGSVGTRLTKRLETLHEEGASGLPTRVKRYRCCGREYMDEALGVLQFVQYGVNLKPWDHAPGVLIAEEAGYHAAFLEDGAPYDASGGVKTGHLMVAPDLNAWNNLRDLLWT